MRDGGERWRGREGREGGEEEGMGGMEGRWEGGDEWDAEREVQQQETV